MRHAIPVLALALMCSCVNTAAIHQRHAMRANNINARYAKQRTEVTAQWNEVIRLIEKRREYLIPIAEGGGYQPLDLIWESTEVRVMRSFCSKEEYRDVADECRKRLRDMYFDALERRYNRADTQWVAAQLQAHDDADLESLLAYSHNSVMLAEIERELAEVKRKRDEHLALIERGRVAEISMSATERNRELAEADARRRRAAAILAAGIDGYLNPPGYPRRSTPTKTPAVVEQGCRSDFDCGVGSKCVKNYYESEGVCYRSWDYSAPDVDSFMPNTPEPTDCNSVGCPAGGICDFKSGACLL